MAIATVSSFATALDTLRGRLVRAKGFRPLADIAVEVGVSRPTLVSFLHGGTSTTATVLMVERWLDEYDVKQTEVRRG